MSEYFVETNYYAVLTNVLKSIDENKKRIERINMDIYNSRRKAIRLLEEANDEELAIWFAEQCAK